MDYALRRLLQSVFLLLGVTLVVFLLLRLTPGDPATIMLGDAAGPQAIEDLRRAMGLDRPLHEQYLRYLGNLLRGDFGTSIRAQQPVLPYIMERFPATVLLAVASFLLALLVSLPVGILSATKRYTLWDKSAMLAALLGQSIPGFWLGLMLISIFAVQLGWLPSSGRGEGAEGVRYLILPSVTLASFLVGLLIRLTRSGMLEVLDQDYIRTARAKGLRERSVLVGHALKNALIPLITVMGIQFGTLLGGAVVTETVFAWPGVGSLVVQAISQRDYPVVQAIVFLLAACFILINLAVDLLYHRIDPRIRLG